MITPHLPPIVQPAAKLIISTNCTGHPSLTVPVNLKESGSPHGITMVGRLFDEGTLLRLGREIDRVQQQAAAPMASETHGGEDVAIISSGPWSHLYTGIHEQTYVAYVMMKAQCLGVYENDDHCRESSGRCAFSLVCHRSPCFEELS